jgi:hypothetical protein
MPATKRALIPLTLLTLLVAVFAQRGSSQAAQSSVAAPLAVTAGGDTCAAPTVISTLPYNASGDTTGAADDIRLTGCSGFLGMGGADHIYSITVQSASNLTFTVTPTDVKYDPAIYLRTACAQGSGSCVARSDVGLGGQAETINVTGLPPGTYYFFVDSLYGADEVGGFGPYNISVTGTLGTPNNSSFFTLTPCRVLDTRDPAGAWGGPALSGGVVRTFTVANRCGVPPTAKSISINATITQPTAQGHLVIFPAGSAVPLASTINFRAGQTRANNAIVPLGVNGAISVVSGEPAGQTVHFILDVNGYFQ